MHAACAVSRWRIETCSRKLELGAVRGTSKIVLRCFIWIWGRPGKVLLPIPARNCLPRGHCGQGASHRSGGASLQLFRHSLPSSCSCAEVVKRVFQFSFELTTPPIVPA